MSWEEAIFWVVAAVTVVGAFGVVSARNIVHSALFLIHCSRSPASSS
jgi:NADH:ubiquinone oxidoreductase subunit 6 (subunit J)